MGGLRLNEIQKKLHVGKEIALLVQRNQQLFDPIVSIERAYFITKDEITGNHVIHCRVGTCSLLDVRKNDNGSFSFTICSVYARRSDEPFKLTMMGDKFYYDPHELEKHEKAQYKETYYAARAVIKELKATTLEPEEAQRCTLQATVNRSPS